MAEYLPPAGSTCLVVGCNRGLGLEITKALAAGGVRTFGTSRRPCEELSAVGVGVIEGIDMEDEAAGAKIIAGLPEGSKVDTLMLVAGYFTTETIDELNFSEQRKMMEICAFAPLRITQALVAAGVLQAGAKIGMITSEGGSIGLRTEAEGGANYGHHMSKCAQNMMGKILALDLKPKGIALVMVHPGFLKTDMTAHYSHFYEEFGAMSPTEAVGPILMAVKKLDLNVGEPGRFIAPMGSRGLGLGVNALPNSFLEDFGELPCI